MSDQQLPAPLVPAEVDLRGYEFMPLYGDRAFGSVSWLSASTEGRLAMLRLWWRCYSQEVPAGSLPDQDALLCEYAGYGAAPRAWRKVREQALTGFIKCSDGRLYHKFVSPLAIEAWEFRNSQRNRTEAARLARLSHRQLQTEKSHSKPSVTDSTGQDRTGQDRKSKAMSGSTPDAHPSRAEKLNGFRTQAVEVLDFLNTKTGRRYRPVPANLDLIIARLKDGTSVDDLRSVVAKKCREWLPDAKMAEYLRPATLFNRTKFAQYEGELKHALP